MSAKHFEPLENRQLMSASIINHVLTVTGNNSANEITISKNASGSFVVTEKTGTTTNTTNHTDGSLKQITVNALGGADTVRIETSVTVPALVRGGEGDDEITGSNQADRLFGGGGTDFLVGRGGNDTLAAGTGDGIDLLLGGEGDDSLVTIGGSLDNAFGEGGRDVFWCDRLGQTTSDIIDNGSTETVNVVTSFQQLRRVGGGGVVTTSSPSTSLAGGSLLDPDPFVPGVTATTNQNFADEPLFGSTISNRDINQGKVGTCAFLSTLASVAQRKSSFIRDSIVELGDGTYAVRFQGLFGKEFLRIDADLPTISGNLAYARRGDNGSLWGAIFEKAWAFRRFNNGQYLAIDGSFPTDTMNALGLSNSTTEVGSILGGSQSAISDKIKADKSAGKVQIFCTKSETTDMSPTTNLLNDHCYAVDTFETNASGQVSRVRLYNPHGTDNTPSTGTTDTNTADGFVWVTMTDIMASCSHYVSATV